jgi:hypothetical protein
MLPVTRAKVWSLWIAALAMAVPAGLWMGGALRIPGGVGGFLEGFTVGFLVAPILVTVQYLRRERTGS